MIRESANVQEIFGAIPLTRALKRGWYRGQKSFSRPIH